MREDMKEALWGPRWFLMGIIIILGLIGIGIIGRLGNHLEVAIPIFLIALLPFVVPYILSFFYPVLAGWIIILETAIPILWFVSHNIHGLLTIHLTKKGILMILLVGFSFISIGIWMIVSDNKIIKKQPDKENLSMPEKPPSRTWEN